MQVHKWEFVILQWKSGSGKSTLVKLILGELAIPKKAVFFDWDDVGGFNWNQIQDLRRKIWVVFQDYKIFEDQTVMENIILPMEIAWFGSHTLEARCKNALQLVNLEDKLNEKMRYLSWWEKQKVAIARALVTNPTMIIADEPTWNLDPENSKIIANTLIALNKENMTVLLISHDTNLIEYVSANTNWSKISLQ